MNIEDCVSIGTDGCSVMKSQKCGAVSYIRKFAKNSIWASCFNHSLNLSITKSANVSAIKECYGTVSTITNFLNVTSKRNFVLKKHIEKKLTSLCNTRWVERHHTIQNFCKELKNVDTVLQKLKNWHEPKVKQEATCYSKSIDLEFIISLHSLNFLYDFTYPISKVLQTISLDIDRANDEIKNLINVLNQKRSDAENVFSNIWRNIVEVASDFNLEICKPRTTGRQKHRPNFEGNPEEYYRRSIFIPILDEIINDLCERFSKDSCDSLKISQLLPKNFKSLTIDSQKIIFEKYSTLIGCESIHSFFAEVDLWKNRFKNDNFYDIKFFFNVYNDNILSDLYPNIMKLLKIYFSMPCSVASGERSFSALRRLKTWLRNTMSEERLSSLAIIHVNYSFQIDPENVINRFATKSKNRKMEFMI